MDYFWGFLFLILCIVLGAPTFLRFTDARAGLVAIALSCLGIYVVLSCNKKPEFTVTSQHADNLSRPEPEFRPPDVQNAHIQSVTSAAAVEVGRVSTDSNVEQEFRPPFPQKMVQSTLVEGISVPLPSSDDLTSPEANAHIHSVTSAAAVEVGRVSPDSNVDPEFRPPFPQKMVQSTLVGGISVPLPSSDDLTSPEANAHIQSVTSAAAVEGGRASPDSNVEPEFRPPFPQKMVHSFLVGGISVPLPSSDDLTSPEANAHIQSVTSAAAVEVGRVSTDSNVEPELRSPFPQKMVQCFLVGGISVPLPFASSDDLTSPEANAHIQSVTSAAAVVVGRVSPDCNVEPEFRPPISQVNFQPMVEDDFVLFPHKMVHSFLVGGILVPVDWSPMDEGTEMALPWASSHHPTLEENDQSFLVGSILVSVDGTAANVEYVSPDINDWSPLDDGIEMGLPWAASHDPTSREESDAYIDSVLYGPSRRRRLPVFEAIWDTGEKK